jgi:antitoxin (DNA-binding transcriptional repressor) of toxin-antitoxin stability system
MTITASQLRADVYRLLDRVIETGEPLEIERNGTIVRIVPPVRKHWLDRLPRREAIAGDPDAIVHVDWSEYWNPDPL